MRLFREGHYREALVKLEEAHRLSPRSALIENLLGITETQLGNAGAANEHYSAASKLDPSSAAPHKNLGFNLLNAKDFPHAESELREAVRLDPKDDFAHYYLLLLALATGQDAEVLEQAPHTGRLLENDAEADAAIIKVEVRTGNLDAAARRIERMETAKQLSPAAEYEVATLLYQRAAYEEAVHCFRSIASADPAWANRFNLAFALLADGQFAEAAAVLSALHDEQPANADVLMYLGLAYEMQQKMPGALKAYRGAMIADPANPDRTLDYTRLLMDLDRYDEAIEAVKSGLGKATATQPLQLRMGAVEMIKGDYAAAREAFRKALDADPDLDEAYVGLAQAYAREGNDAEAIHILEQARDKHPDHYFLLYYFGLLAGRLNREAEALSALERAAQLEPGSPDPFFELGKLYAAQRDWPRARQAFEHVVELNPQFIPAHFQLSRIYGHLGLRSEAEQEGQRTQALIDMQREGALRRQRAQGASFQAQPAAESSH